MLSYIITAMQCMQAQTKEATVRSKVLNLSISILESCITLTEKFSSIQPHNRRARAADCRVCAPLQSKRYDDYYGYTSTLVPLVHF